MTRELPLLAHIPIAMPHDLDEPSLAYRRSAWPAPMQSSNPKVSSNRVRDGIERKGDCRLSLYI